jgi:hypothetical protein
VFRCQICSKVSQSGTPARRVVVQARTKTYLYRSCANTIVRADSKGKLKKIHIDDPGGIGHEAVKEVLACPECVAGRGADP